jgi:hypothetical protein
VHEDHRGSGHPVPAAHRVSQERPVVDHHLEIERPDPLTRPAAAGLDILHRPLACLEGGEGLLEHPEEPRARQRRGFPPRAKTASPSISWISSGGERWPTTSSSRAAMISEPCSSSVVVTKAVNPDTSARIR